MMIAMRSAIPALGLLVAVLGGCLPTGTSATLAPTLTMVETGGLQVAMQNGHPVPSYEWQPRPRLELDGPWRVERIELDQRLTMSARDTSLEGIEEAASGRQDSTSMTTSL